MPRTAIIGDIPVGQLPLSPASRAGDCIFVSGQASVDHTGAYVEEDFAGEMNRSMSIVKRILAAAGASMDDVVQVRAYLGDSAYREEYNASYGQHTSTPLPARTTTSGGISSLKFEVDVAS